MTITIPFHIWDKGKFRRGARVYYILQICSRQIFVDKDKLKNILLVEAIYLVVIRESDSQMDHAQS